MKPRSFDVVVPEVPGYPHTACFDEVVDTLMYGLQELGHRALRTNRPTGDAQAIVLAPHLLGYVNWQMPTNAIAYNFEVHSSAMFSQALDHLRRASVVWDYSSANIARLRELNFFDVRHVPLGFVRKLTRAHKQEERVIDVLFYGSTNARRDHIIDELHKKKINVVGVFNCYGDQRDGLIACSKVVLNMHFYEDAPIEQVRLAHLLTNRVCIVSENACDAKEVFGDAIDFVAYDKLVDRCVELVNDAAARDVVAEHGFREFSRKKESEILAVALR